MAINDAARDAKDTAEQVIPVTAEVPDAPENLDNEFKHVKESEEQFLGGPLCARAADTESGNRS